MTQVRIAVWLCLTVAACASRPRCVPVDWPLMSGAKAQVEVKSTNDVGMVHVSVIADDGLPLQSAPTITITPDSGQPFTAAEAQVVHRTLRPFRLSVRAVGRAAADTVIVPPLGTGVDVRVVLPHLYANTPSICIER
jgi:hypothetical protein